MFLFVKKNLFFLLILIPNICIASGKINCNFTKIQVYEFNSDVISYEGMSDGIRKDDKLIISYNKSEIKVSIKDRNDNKKQTVDSSSIQMTGLKDYIRFFKYINDSIKEHSISVKNAYIGKFWIRENAITIKLNYNKLILQKSEDKFWQGYLLYETLIGNPNFVGIFGLNCVQEGSDLKELISSYSNK